MFTALETKDPDAVKSYTFDWSDWLEPGEIVVTYTITVPAGITNDSDANTSTTVRVTLSGGTDGDNYDIECEIVTNSTPPQTDHRTFNLPVAHT